MTNRPSIDTATQRARLAVRHHLAPEFRTDDVVTIADDVVTLHSSDPVTVYLSAAARMRNPSIAAMSDALYERRSLVRHHAMRRTLWVLSPDMARIAHASATMALVPKQRRALESLLESCGVAADGHEWLESARTDTLSALERLGPLPSRKLGHAVPALREPLQVAAGKAYAATPLAHTRVLLLLGFEGQIIRTRPTGTWINSEYTWAPAGSWLEGGFGNLDPIDAAGQLAHRYLHAFGPVLATDLQWWAGWTGGLTKRALDVAGAVQVDLDGAVGWVAADDVESFDGDAEAEPWVALLPGLDPTTMGWKQRDWYLPKQRTPLLFDRNGNAGPTIWVDGEIVGGWVQRRTGEIACRVLSDIGAERMDDVARSAEALRTLLADTRFSVRFPAPIQRELFAEHGSDENLASPRRQP